MSWNYRVIHTEHETPTGKETRYAIHEVYYDDGGKVTRWTAEPTWPQGETPEEFSDDLMMYKSAVMKSALAEEDLPGGNK